ncbi:MAG: hypothetical protein ACFB5Z_00220 [Elainellaceae cyanobacterium]
MSLLHQSASSEQIQARLAQIESTGKISRYEYFQLMTRLLANQASSADESARINQIADSVRLNRVQLVD